MGVKWAMIIPSEKKGFRTTESNFNVSTVPFRGINLKHLDTSLKKK
jgi:hypothetical protein